MLDPGDRIPGFRERHPRITSALYQIGLSVTTFFLVMTIQRTLGRICARVDELDYLTAADVYLCRFLDVVMPHFMAYPSTTTVMAAIILFLTGIFMLNYHNRNDAAIHMTILSMITGIINVIEWKRFFASLQDCAPNIIWTSSVLSALFHPIFRWAFPKFNTMFVTSMHNVYKELLRGRPNQGSREKLPSLGRG